MTNNTVVQSLNKSSIPLLSNKDFRGNSVLVNLDWIYYIYVYTLKYHSIEYREMAVAPATVFMPLAINCSTGFVPAYWLLLAEKGELGSYEPNGPSAGGARRVFGNPKPPVLASLKQRGGFVYVPLRSTTKPQYGKT